MSPPADRLCLTQAQAPASKGRVSSLPTTSGGKLFQLWALGIFCTERHLAKCLKNNSFYPFVQQQPNGTAGRTLTAAVSPAWGGLFQAGALALSPPAASRGRLSSRGPAAPSPVFVLEYYLDTLWKGTLLFVVCLFLVSFGLVGQVQKQETWGIPAYGVGVGLWIMISSLPRRRLVLNHTRGIYHFSIQGRTVCQGPMHLVYVRLARSFDAYGKCFFQLVLCGHKLEPLVLVKLSERYEGGAMSQAQGEHSAVLCPACALERAERARGVTGKRDAVWQGEGPPSHAGQRSVRWVPSVGES
ncbi:hypothetical protein PAL_GLEAN10010490 [Pteropus alecto]|uniref:Transmembrane protein 249 n=1 Tax=Pteropus alecto TaxID=9402 RepID=L5KJJ3_PTEAL|nr:hypothetical protein PAL_GLEAN10010490 [Pteropus alecto]